MSPLEALFAPMTAGPRDALVGYDELGNPIYRTALGQTYSRGPQPLPPPAPPRERVETRLDGQGRAVHHGTPDPLPAGVEALNGLASMFADSIAAPGRAARGEPVTLGDALGTAIDWAALGAPLRAPEGALRMFAGRNARTADRAALSRAEDMAAAGADPEAIWRETGWYQGQDGAWRFEIDDSGSTFTRPRKPVASLGASGSHLGALPRMFDHEAIYEAYPELRTINVFEAEMEPGAVAAFRGLPGDARDPAWLTLSPRYSDPRSATLHEVQHGIQFLEGFAPGASPLDEIAPSTRRMSADEAEARRRAAMRAYQIAPGEVEARNVQTRRDMTPEERRAVPPWVTER